MASHPLPPQPLNIVVIDPWVTANPAVGHDRTSSLVRALSHANHKITLLAGRGRAEGGINSSVHIKRILPTQTRKFGYAPKSATGFGYGLRLFLALLRHSIADVVIVRTPPRAGGFLLSCFAALFGAAVIIDAPELAAENQKPNLLARALNAIALRVLRRKAAHVFAASADIKAWFDAHGFAGDVSVHPDGSETTLFAPTREVQTAFFEKYPHLARGPLCIYAGNIHRGRSVAKILEIAAAIQSIAPDLRFAIIGDGPDRLDLNAYAARLDVLEKNLWFIPALPRSELPAVLNAATLAIALPSRVHDGGLDGGSHLFDGLAAGKPIAVIGNGWQREMIEVRQAGVALPDDNAEAAARELADFLRDGDLVRRAGEQALALARGKNDKERILTEMRQIIEKVASTHSREEVWTQRSLALKRVSDVLASVVLLSVLSPLFIVLSLGFLAAGWMPFAGRMRSGLRGKPFRLFTFDTMKAERAAEQSAPSWRNSYARFLRRSALDRLPELFNVLLGDMSLVGPRPLPAEYKTYYTEAQLHRLDVRPGVTGWAQVQGRTGLTWDEMFAADGWYVDNRSWWLDTKILARTLMGLLLGCGFGAMPSGQLPRFDEIEARRQGAEDA